MANNFTSVEGSITERIKRLCYKLEHYTFLSEEVRAKMLSEVKTLVEQREQLRKTLTEGFSK